MTPWNIVTGDPIEVKGVCHIRQARLSDIRALGYEKFFEYISVVMFDPNELSENLPLLPRNTGAFIFLISLPEFSETLSKALHFFVVEEIKFNDARLQFDIYDCDKVIGCINNENFADIQGAIIQTIGGKKENEKKLKFQSKKAQEIYEKCKARKKEFDNQKKSSYNTADETFSIPNLVSAVCAKHPSLNFTNIWDLTILQLYDQFKRLNIITYESVEGLRWAAWGKDSIELSAWHKNLNT